MADIKAKDIAIASSVASNDLILGSSIAGTTANVTVETVGNFILNNFPKSDLGNQSILPYTKNIHDKIKQSNILSKAAAPKEKNVYSNVASFTLSAPTLVYIKYEWVISTPKGIFVSDGIDTGNIVTPLIMATYQEVISGKMNGYISATGYLERAGTYYVYIKSDSTNVPEQPSIYVKKLIEFYT
jgi:hypothetical protein